MAKEVKLRQGWVDVQEIIDAAPTTADYVVATASDGLSAERVATDSATIDVNTTTPGQMAWDVIAPLPVTHGGTGQTTEAEAFGEMIQVLTVDDAPDRIADTIAYRDAAQDTGNRIHMWAVAGVAVLATGSVSSGASLDLALDTTGFDAFKIFKLIVSNLAPETDAAVPFLRFSDDGGATFEADAADYGWIIDRGNDDATSDAQRNASDSEITLTGSLGNVAGEGADLEITIYNPAAVSPTRVTWVGLRVDEGGVFTCINGAGRSLVAAASTDVRLLMSAGDFSCNYTLMGIE